MEMVPDWLGNERTDEMKCCNQDCNQGRDCPHKTSALRVGDVMFTVVTLVITASVAVSIMWWVITAVMMIVEALK